MHNRSRYLAHHRRVRGCWRKHQFKDRIRAAHAAQRMQQRVYACDNCGYWHLTKLQQEKSA